MASEPAVIRRWRPRTPARRIALAVGAALGTFVILLVLDGAWAGTRLQRSLTHARSELLVGVESLVTGDPKGAAPHFAAAGDAADDALGEIGHPSMGIAGLLPVVGDNIDTAAAVAKASKATAAAGTTMVEAARELNWTDFGIPGSAAAGELDLSAFDAALPDMETAAADLQLALARLDDGGVGRLIGPIAAGYRDAVEGLARRADLAVRFRNVVRLVPVMFGGDRPRRYLVCVPALGIPRPGGGAPAATGLLTATGGSLHLEPLEPAPASLAQVQASPDWPATARALVVAAREAGSPPLDGVILVDAVALEDLVWMIGDVSVEGRPLALSDRTTATALEIDAFLGNSPAKTAGLHAAWVSDILLQFLIGRPGLESFALATARDARDRHLAVFLKRPDDERLVRALGLDGRARLGGKGILPVAASWSASDGSHVGALVGTSIDYDVTVRADGSAAVQTQVIFENRAAAESPPSVLLGRPASETPVGTFAADVTLYLPADAREVVAETSRPSPIEAGADLGLVTVTGSIAVRGHDSATLTVTYVIDHAIEQDEGTRAMHVRLLPQPTLGGIRYQVRINLPDGSTISSASPELERRGDTALFSRVRAGPVDLELRYV